MSTSILNNPQNVDIGNLSAYAATNINIHNTTHIQPLPKDPIDILHYARAIQATHTSTLASHAAKCHPKTRLKVIADIVEWVTARDGDPPKPMLWFPGPAGAGKTTIMRSVVERCEEVGLLAASYFFSSSTRATGLNHERPFMATIAHQLSIDLVLGPLILDAISRRPTIFQESLDLQMKKLVIDPLKSYPHKILIAVDGLDECSEKSERKHLLGLFYTLAHTLPTLSIVIASRPEQDIREMFDKRDFKQTTHVLRLEDYDGMDDNRVYVCDEFQNIRETHPMKRFLPLGWPVEEDVGILLDKSSGIFIISSTAMKHIANPRRDPVKSLEEVLALWSRTPPSGANQENPLAELDLLYHLILHPPETDLALAKRLLHSLVGIVAVIATAYQSSSFLEEFLQLPPGTVGLTLCDFHSVLSIPEDDGPVRFHHKSLEDYLLSPSRSLDMFQEPYKTHLDLMLHCVDHLQRWASDSDQGSISRGQNVNASYHSAQYWDNHLGCCLEDRPKSVPLPNAILDFDPRIAWRAFFPDAFLISSVENDQTIHENVCGGGPCSQLCNTMGWMVKCESKVRSFFDSFEGKSVEKRIEALGRFDIETGLYDPNAQFGSSSGVSSPAIFPGLGAWPTFPSSSTAVHALPAPLFSSPSPGQTGPAGATRLPPLIRILGPEGVSRDRANGSLSGRNPSNASTFHLAKRFTPSLQDDQSTPQFPLSLGSEFGSGQASRSDLQLHFHSTPPPDHFMPLPVDVEPASLWSRIVGWFAQFFATLFKFFITD